jgi:hypothetical protein
MGGSSVLPNAAAKSNGSSAPSSKTATRSRYSISSATSSVARLLAGWSLSLRLLTRSPPTPAPIVALNAHHGPVLPAVRLLAEGVAGGGVAGVSVPQPTRLKVSSWRSSRWRERF